MKNCVKTLLFHNTFSTHEYTCNLEIFQPFLKRINFKNSEGYLFFFFLFLRTQGKNKGNDSKRDSVFRGFVWKQSTWWSFFKNLEKQLLWLREGKNDIIWARVMWPWDGVWQEDGEHRVPPLKDTVSTPGQTLGLWVPGVKFFGILEAFRSLCYESTVGWKHYSPAILKWLLSSSLMSVIYVTGYAIFI